MASTLTNLLFHVVFGTKNRMALIEEANRDELYSYIGGIIRAESGKLLEIGGTVDHVHLLVRFPASISVAEMLKAIKANSSRWRNRSLPTENRFAWQTGYAAYSVSASQVSHVRRYIQEQEAHHRRRSFKEEYIALLEAHGVEYDERFMLE